MAKEVFCGPTQRLQTHRIVTDILVKDLRIFWINQRSEISFSASRKITINALDQAKISIISCTGNMDHNKCVGSAERDNSRCFVLMHKSQETNSINNIAAQFDARS